MVVVQDEEGAPVAGASIRAATADVASNDFAKTDADSDVNRVRKATIGFSWKLFENEVAGGRLVLEGARSKTGSESSNSGLLNLLWAF